MRALQRFLFLAKLGRACDESQWNQNIIASIELSAHKTAARVDAGQQNWTIMPLTFGCPEHLDPAVGVANPAICTGPGSFRWRLNRHAKSTQWESLLGAFAQLSAVLVQQGPASRQAISFDAFKAR